MVQIYISALGCKGAFVGEERDGAKGERSRAGHNVVAIIRGVSPGKSLLLAMRPKKLVLSLEEGPLKCT